MSETTDTEWISAHVFYNDRLDALITAVLPALTEELRGRGLADDYFFLRYWDGGHHLRFRVLPRQEAAADQIRAVVARRFRDYLTAHPASGAIAPEEYASFAARMTRWEHLSGHAPLRPTNTVEFLPYRREHHRYGHGAAIHAVERHFAESSRVALALLTSGPDTDQRFTAGYAMVTLAWLSQADDPAWDTSWIESDARSSPLGGYLDLLGEEADTRWRRQRETLCRLTRRLRSAYPAVATGGSRGGSLAAWTFSVARLKEALAEEVAAGRFTPPAYGWEGVGHAVAGPAFSVLPVLDICAHLFCNRIGLSLAEEGYVRLLAMRALQETEGEPYGMARHPRLLP